MLELQEERLSGHPEETFVSYRDARIFYKFKPQHQEWFVLVTRIGEEAIVAGYPCLGCDWFKSKSEGLNGEWM